MIAETKMESVILLCDIGNTAIKLGLCMADELATTWSLPTLPNATTADSLGLDIIALLAHAEVPVDAIAACVAVSVVPDLARIFKMACARYLRCPLFFAPQDIPVPLVNEYRNPEELGADRLVAAWGARRMFPEPDSLIIIDYGTAITYDCVEGNKFKGGLIFPGIGTAVQALAKRARKLPLWDFECAPADFGPGLSTREGMANGIIFGYLAVTEGLIHRLKKCLKKPILTVASGGFSKTVGESENLFDYIVPDLTLYGLNSIYKN